MEPRKIRRRVLAGLVIIGTAGAIALIFRPSPQLVDAGRVTRGPLQVTIDQEGETRAHDRFVVSAPVAGRLLRLDLEDGDAVKRNQIVAQIDPLPLGQRERQELYARVQAAEASLREATAREAHAGEDAAQAKRDRQRAERLGAEGVISTQALEQARNADVTAAQELEAARYNVEVAASDLKVAQAGLVGADTKPGAPRPLISLRSPVTGRVLRVAEKSERVVQAGMPIVTLGEPSQLEIVADVLSTDAVKVHPGDPVLLEGWGGDHPIRARVRLVEPSGFTKVSALGVEEQRVNVISDFVDPPGPLGDGYRVECRIVIWSGENVLQVPVGALFRRGQSWAVFRLENGRARVSDIEIGHRNETEAEVRGGLAQNDVVILHPSNQIRDGVRVRTD